MNFRKGCLTLALALALYVFATLVWFQAGHGEGLRQGVPVVKKLAIQFLTAAVIEDTTSTRTSNTRFKRPGRNETSYTRLGERNSPMIVPSSPPSEKWYCNVTAAAKRRQYVIEWVHWEQTTMAIHSLIHLAWFTTPWNARVVEPFVKNSYLYGFNNRARSYKPISEIFAMNDFNDMLCKHDVRPLATFDEFAKYGSKKIIIIHVLFGGDEPKPFGNLKPHRETVDELFRKQNSNVVLCGKTSYMKMISTRLVRTINYSLKPKSGLYSVVEGCCINGFKETTRKEVKEKCIASTASLRENDHTIVVTDWRGISSKLNFRLFSPEIRSASLPNPARDVYPYNKKVKDKAKAFLQSVSNGSPVVLIHYRSEKLASLESTRNGYFDDCVRKSLDLKDKVLSKYQNMSKTHVVACVTGVSKYGSRSCKKLSCPGRKLMNIAQKKYKLNVVSYDPHKFRGLADSAFVAAVEQEMMSMANVLILVGGGSFQMQLKVRYLSRNYSNQLTELHQVCT